MYIGRLDMPVPVVATNVLICYNGYTLSLYDVCLTISCASVVGNALFQTWANIQSFECE